jgi:6-pyruvoyltetrahydropterin/6-carboxytetrahydropterin synthase
MMVKSIILEADFSSAHFYHQPAWTSEKNQEVFGRCFTEYGHGHNYKIRVEIEVIANWDSEIHSARKILSEVVARVDHEHLNFTVLEFKNKIPTSEVILEYFREKLTRGLEQKILNLELFETPTIGARHPVPGPKTFQMR